MSDVDETTLQRVAYRHREQCHHTDFTVGLAREILDLGARERHLMYLVSSLEAGESGYLDWIARLNQLPDREIAPRVRYEVPEIVKMAWKIKQERRDYAAGRVHPGFH